MEKICKTQYGAENEITKSWQNKTLNNNNSEESTCREANGCHPTRVKDVQLATKCDTYENHNDNAEASCLPSQDCHLNTAPLSPNSNETSANNSTDNLSFLSDNGFLEDALILQNNASGDDSDEISINSDDCVYAYRGADYDISDQRVHPPDDETDYLEMDFDPDPASELDHNNESQYEIFNTDDINKMHNDIQQNCNTNGDNKKLCNDEVVTNCNRSLEKLHNNIDDVKQSVNIASKETGAKPKKIINLDKYSKTSKTSLRCNEPFEIVVNYKNSDTNHKDVEEACLDCLEKEFLSKMIGKKLEPFQCSKCSYKISENNLINNSNDSQIFSVDFNLRELSITNETKCILQNNYQRNTSCDNVKENLLNAPQIEVATFSTINIDEKTIVQALEKIDIGFDRDIVRQHFASEQSVFKDVPQLVIYMSKRNCDYKKIIKLIKLASHDQVEIKYTPSEILKTEVVQVSSYDILQSWSKTNNLDKLKKLDKRFLRMNVLGKVINIIRQAQQRNTKNLVEHVLIPQYYKTGYISVNKK